MFCHKNENLLTFFEFLNQQTSSWFCPGTTVVKHLPHNPKIKGLNPGTGRKKIKKKVFEPSLPSVVYQIVMELLKRA
jgi:hypothetical protein